ncbi:protein liaI [Bacillus glycinifermentans]|uniref:protein liaI n=1 Tax=Bacillus glycinifermentans TaxID=1664069 RepID=UPI0006545D67|nr:protein liaI [Bacillus glycinifermentans]KMM56225.1 protein liaI [Bacillus glycinifermentans]MEC0495694.1 protein liaI [Bacillus glycinifermentans]MEC0542081.1 protein liaI [Bacillus glycinifermentans]
MNITGKSVIGFLLILFGISLFFGGGQIGGLIAGAIGAVLLFYGIKKWNDGRFASVILLIIGFMFLGGALPFLIGVAVSAALIYFGWSMMKQGGKKEENGFYSESSKPSAASYDTAFDAEWEDFLKKKQ